MKEKTVTGMVIIALLIIAVFYFNRYRVAPKIDFSRLQLTGLDNMPVKPEVFEHKKLFINFFATWCGPCIREFPDIEGAQAILQNKNYVFICISDEPVERLKLFKERMGINVLILHLPGGLHSVGVYTFPTSYMINERGETVFKKTGELDMSPSELAKELVNRTE